MREHVLYWVFPTTVVAALMAMHFSGEPTLGSILAPRFNRELGLLENLQHAILLVILALVAMRARRATERLERAAFALVAAATTFMFLEEVDYGTHWWNALHGRGDDYIPFSVHNTGRNSDKFKKAGDATMIAFFAVFPIASWRLRNPWITFFRPSAWFLASLAAMLLLSSLAHELNDRGFAADSPIRDSISEFRELFVYYVWLVYLVTLSRRPWPAGAERDGTGRGDP
jgi:hypothetical protein